MLRERTSGTLERLLCGLLIPRDQMAPALQTLADALPLTYAFDALDRVARGDGLSDRLTIDVSVIATVTSPPWPSAPRPCDVAPPNCGTRPTSVTVRPFRTRG